jgi:hypothetical protein
MFMIPTATGFSIAEFSQSPFIDFSVWVLNQCGLRVPPFSTHGEGFERLRSLDIDAVAWQSWFQNLVVSQHTGFRIQQNGADFFVERWRNGITAVPFVYDGYSCFETSLDAEQEPGPRLLARYYDLINQLSGRWPLGSLDLLEVNHPVDLWEGTEAVRSELLNLWTRYCSTPSHRVHHAADLNRRLTKDGVLCEKINELLKDLLVKEDRFLMASFVNYPGPVFVIAGPSIIIGLDGDKPFSPDVFMDLLIQAVAVITSD